MASFFYVKVCDNLNTGQEEEFEKVDGNYYKVITKEEYDELEMDSRNEVVYAGMKCTKHYGTFRK